MVQLCQVGRFVKRYATDDALDWKSECPEPASLTIPFPTLCQAHGAGLTALLEAHSVDTSKASHLSQVEPQIES